MELITFHLPSEYWAKVKALRLSVFVDEMNVPADMEIDEDDQHALHFAYKNHTEIVATLRILSKENEAKIGRVAVHQRYRRQGVGSQLMVEAIEYCRGQGIQTIRLGSQTYITQFYRNLGFREQGEIFLDAGIPHIEMTRHV